MEHKTKVFSWREANDWKPQLQSSYFGILDQPLIQAIREKAPAHEVIGNLSWLDALLVKHYRNPASAVIQGLRTCFAEKYASVRAYHGCRVKDISSYRDKGLIPFDPERYQQLAHEYFLNTGHTAGIRQKFEEISAVQSHLLYEGEISFHLDDRFIVDYAGYYLIYGSHSLFATAILLSRATEIDFKRVLTQLGKPTIFICDIPLSLLATELLTTLCKTLLVEIVQNPAQHKGEPRITECCLTVRERLPPTFIVGHYSPGRVKDVLYDNHIGDI